MIFLVGHRPLQTVVQDCYKQLYKTVEAIVFRPWKHPRKEGGGKDRSNFLPAKNESIAVSIRENKKNVKLSRTVQYFRKRLH